MFIDEALTRETVYFGRGEWLGEIDGVRISFDDRLEDDEDRLAEDADDEDDERVPPVEMSDGTGDDDNSGGGVELVLSLTFFWDVVADCSKVLRNSETFG